MTESNNTVDALDVLLRGQAVRQFQVQMIIQNPAIAALQSNKLRVQLGLENLPLIERNYFIRTAAKFNRLEEKPTKFKR